MLVLAVSVAALGSSATAGAALGSSATAGAAEPLRPAGQGCAMAHCDAAMSDLVRLSSPASITSTRLDATAASASQGLGCSANGKIAVCTFGDQSGDRTRPYMKAYDGAGKRLWDSGRALNAWAWTSVPMVDAQGGAISADDRSLVRFAPGGRPMWTTRTPGGRPISPTHTANGAIFLATAAGPVSAYDGRSGRLLASLDLRATIDGQSGRFDTTNTPGARGNRVYVSTDFKLDSGAADPNHHARLFAIDVDPTKPRAKRLRVAWFFEFGARSGASPLVVGDAVIFDGDRTSPSSPQSPRFFGVRDLGSRPKLLWEAPLGGPGVASAAEDPRGGAWTFAFGQPAVRRISLTTGHTVQEVDLDALVDDAGRHAAYSAMSISTGPSGHPVMTVTARAGLTSAYLLAVDLVSSRLLWKYRMPGPVLNDTAMGQFPVVARRDGGRSVFFTTKAGVRHVTGPAG